MPSTGIQSGKSVTAGDDNEIDFQDNWRNAPEGMTASEICRKGKFASSLRHKLFEIDNFGIISSKINWQFRLRAAARWQLLLNRDRKEFPHARDRLWSRANMTAQQVPRANFANKSRSVSGGMSRAAAKLGGRVRGIEWRSKVSQNVSAKTSKRRSMPWSFRKKLFSPKWVLG